MRLVEPPMPLWHSSATKRLCQSCPGWRSFWKQRSAQMGWQGHECVCVCVHEHLYWGSGEGKSEKDVGREIIKKTLQGHES